MSTPRSALIRRVLIVVAVALAATACAADVVKSYDDPQAKANFVNGCTTERKIVDGKAVTTLLAPKKTCECVFHDIWKVYELSWDDLTSYEAQVASASAANPPARPAQLTKAINACRSKSGFTVPKSTTTSGG